MGLFQRTRGVSPRFSRFKSELSMVFHVRCLHGWNRSDPSVGLPIEWCEWKIQYQPDAKVLRSGLRMYTRKFTRMYTRTACRSYSYVHADKFTTTRARILSAENQGKQRRAACAESASSGRWRKQAGIVAILATKREGFCRVNTKEK